MIRILSLAFLRLDEDEILIFYDFSINPLIWLDSQGFQLRTLSTIDVFLCAVLLKYFLKSELSRLRICGRQSWTVIDSAGKGQRKECALLVGQGGGGPPWQGSAPPIRSGRHPDVTTVGNVFPHHRSRCRHPR